MNRIYFVWAVFSVVLSGLHCSSSVGARNSSDTGAGKDALLSDDLQEETQESILPLVNPFIGSAGRGWFAGSAFVGATLPFGMVQVGPDTRPTDVPMLPWDHCSGYHYEDDVITAFSHTHLHGTGIPDLGAVGFMPVSGGFRSELMKQDGYESRMDKKSEVASPGYYSVVLLDHGIKVELTAGVRTAFHRYTLIANPPPDRMTVVIDTSHTLIDGLVKDGAVLVSKENREVSGWALNQNDFSRAFGGVPFYFVAQTDKDFATFGTWKNGMAYPETSAQEGARVGAFLEFAGTTVLTVKVGISFTSIEKARANLEADDIGFDFDKALARAERTWEDELSRIRFSSGSDQQRRVMATALYHALLMPNTFSDADGSYVGYDRQVHKAEGFTYYSNFSLWDTYRSLHSLLTLIAPERQRDMVQSLVVKEKEGGFLPRWDLAIGETNVMIGTPADIVVAETYLKGITDFDVQNAYDAARKAATKPAPKGSQFALREGIDDYLTFGYLPYDHAVSGTVSRTLEYAIADAALARLAKALGKTEDFQMFFNNSKNFENLWDDATGYFRPRLADGSFAEPFDPLSVELSNGKGYVEGNALQYLWLVPQDPYRLMKLLGGQKAMAERLRAFFEGAVAEREIFMSEKHDPLWYFLNQPQHYWHGNEPDIHSAYLFLQAGRPDLTQEWVRWIMENLYSDKPDGIPGNDDAGTLSAWFIFSAMGFFPVFGTDLYLVGVPLFPDIKVRTAKGILHITAPGADKGMGYVASVSLNGKRLEVPWFRHKDIVEGGELHFELSQTPTSWGVIGEDTPIPID